MKTAIALAAALIGVAGIAAAQQVDQRWTPWIGCWQLVEGSGQVCVAPGPDGGITSRTEVPGEPALEQTIVADGAPHPLSEGACTGTQHAEWARGGGRLFVRAELTCPGQSPRTISGLATIAPDATWLDVQAVEIAGRTTVRVRRYRRVAPDAASAQGFISPQAGGARWTLEQVKEASAKVPAAVLEAALAETGARFALDSRELLALDDAGVPGSVIDLMVAQSFPGEFRVERRDQASPAASAFDDPFYSSYPGYYGNYPYYYGSDPYYYMPFAYGLYGYHGPYAHYYYPRSVVVIDNGVAVPPEEDNDGRAVKGVGYTRSGRAHV